MYKVLLSFFFVNLSYGQELNKSCINKIINSESHFGIDEFDRMPEDRRVKLIGDKKVKSITCIDFHRNGKEAFKYYYKYSDEGFIIRAKVYYIGYDKYNQDKIIQYDGSKVVQELDELTNNKVVYEYRKNYRLKKLYNNETKETVLHDSIQYNSAMQIKEITFFNQSVENLKTASFYIENQEVKKTSYIKNKLRKTEMFVLNTDEQCKNISLCNVSRGEKITLSYDEYDNLILKSTINADDNEVTNQQKFEYKLDSHNNWVERYGIMGEGKVLISKRIIEYFE